MPSEKSNRGGQTFDVASVEKLIRLMSENDLTEIDVHSGNHRVRLRKGGAPVASAVPVHAHSHTASPPPVTAAHAATAPADHKKYHIIASPTPGTFYSKPSPEEAPFVKVGSRVTPDSVVCKIEAMKIFNDIAAECTGTIVEILVENAQPVEYGQPLFRVDIG